MHTPEDVTKDALEYATKVGADCIVSYFNEQSFYEPRISGFTYRLLLEADRR